MNNFIMAFVEILEGELNIMSIQLTSWPRYLEDSLETEGSVAPQRFGKLKKTADRASVIRLLRLR